MCIVFILYKQFNFISLGIYKKYFAYEKSTEVWFQHMLSNKFEVFNFQSLRVRKSGFQNAGKVCLWNPESGKILLIESGIQGIRNLTKRLESRIRVPLTKTGIQYLESESMVWNPESKTVLDSLIWSYFSFALMNLRHNNKGGQYRLKTFMCFGVERSDWFIFSFRAGWPGPPRTIKSP